MKTIFVTGAAGMIGRAIVEALLNKGYNVIGTDKAPSQFEGASNFSYVQCEITDKDKIIGVLEGSKVDVLVHTACTVDNDFPDVLTSAEEKISATVDKYIYKAAESSGVKDILMISTHQVYAPQKTREPIREGAADKPYTVYGKMKSDSEKAFASALKKTQTSKGVIMRICPIYTKDFIENLKSKIYDPKDGCAFVYGYGDYGYSFTCLYNIVDFVLGVLACPDGISYQGVYNICDTKPISAKDIVDTLREEHKIGAVIQRTYGSETLKSAASIFGSKASKTEYRYNDLSVACSNISYDNTKAQRISTFRWKLSNTK